MSTYNDSRKGLHKICQILGTWQCKWLSVSSSAPRTSVSSIPFPEKFFFFCTGRFVTTVLPSVVPLPRVDDCVEIHILHWELCDPLSPESPTISLWARLRQCVRLLPGAFVILVLKQISQLRSFGTQSLPDTLLVAALKVIHEKNWKRLGVLEHYHPPDLPWTLLAILADHATGLRFLLSPRRVSSYFSTHTLSSYWCGILCMSYGFLRWSCRRCGWRWAWRGRR